MGLILHYDFTEGSGSTLNDQSTSNDDASLSGSGGT